MILGEKKIGRNITIKTKRNKNFNRGEIWYGLFPLDEDKNKFTVRPIIVLDVGTYDILAVKVTKQKKRDDLDIPIENWEFAGLDVPSIARISKYTFILKRQFDYKIGDLHSDDIQLIEEKFREYINSF